MIKLEQIKTLDNDSIIDQLHLILNKIEELDLRQGSNPKKSSKSKRLPEQPAIEKPQEGWL